jgi:hypothetical protein
MVMKRLAKAAALTVASCTLVMGGAGAAAATNDHGAYKKDQKHGKHHGKKHHNDDGVWGFAAHSPGVISGNTIQIPIDIQANVCGNSIIPIIPIISPNFAHCVNKD